MPTVSIITPSWNVEGLIGETIESVQAQTFGDWELLIADDCSKDNTAAVVEGYAAKDPRVKLIRQPRNGGRMPLATTRSTNVLLIEFIATRSEVGQRSASDDPAWQIPVSPDCLSCTHRIR